MKLKYLHQLMTLLVLNSAAMAQTVPPPTTLPEPPAIQRQVTGIKYINPQGSTRVARGPVNTGPHVPTLHTTRDGRIGIDFRTAKLTLLRPEQLTNYVRLTDAPTLLDNSYVMTNKDVRPLRIGESSSDPDQPNVGSTSSENAKDIAHEANFFSLAVLPPGSVGGMRHVTLFDPTPINPTTGERTNPRNVNNRDVYDLNVIVAFEHHPSDPNTPTQIRFFVTPVQVTVSSPKTPNAEIESVVRTGPSVAGPVYPFVNAQGLELNVVDGGRLIALRLGGGEAAWTNPNTGVTAPYRDYNIVYSYNNGAVSWPLNPNSWTHLHPISHAPYDSRFNTRLGFALRPFRDAAGVEIPDGVEFGPTYPWIDPDGKNLFFTIIGDILRYQREVSYSQSRYYNLPTVAGQPNPSEAEDFGPTRGVSFAGLWSHGKIVTIDNLNNDMDYAMTHDLYSREVRLYDPGSNPILTQQYLTLGGGRVNSLEMPDGDVGNTGLIESLTNVFNYREFAKPTTVRDVVWPIHNPKHTADLAFDDYLDHEAFIVSNMSGLVAWDSSRGKMIHHSGWNEQADLFNNQVKLQNAATTPPERFLIPQHGAVTGPGRLEPAASGGVFGKGFWMDGSVGIEYPTSTQTVSGFSSRDRYVGMFLDCRFESTGIDRLLVTFPDGSSIRLNNRNRIRYCRSNGSVAGFVDILPGTGTFANLVPDPGWVHFGWQIKKNGREIDFLINGMLYGRTTVTTTLFQLQGSLAKLVVGHNTSTPSVTGFVGWIDDFKVLAHAVDPETAANHAGGTLVGLLTNYSGSLRDFNNSFPSTNILARTELNSFLEHRGERSYSAFAVHYNYNEDNKAHLGSIPANTHSLRESIHFPEGPLFRNRPRPDSSRNTFCLTCHSSDGEQGLSDLTLDIIPGLNAPDDERRSPSQPFRRLFGNIPAGLVDVVSPATPSSPRSAPAAGVNVDGYIQKTLDKATVKTFSLMDASTKEDLAIIKNGAEVYLASYPNTTSFALRANLDSAQGSVSLRFDNGSAVNRNMLSTNPYPYAISVGALSAGSHTIVATPAGGTAVTVSFTVQ
jgi:hypothetical protein